MSSGPVVASARHWTSGPFAANEQAKQIGSDTTPSNLEPVPKDEWS